MIKSNIEIFKDIPGCEGYYQVSNKGNVKSLSRYVKSKPGQRDYKTPSRILKTNIDKRGYHRVELNVNGNSKKHLVHRLVAKTFIPNPENKPNIDHINTNTSDNRVENLRWCTQKENIHNPISFKRNRESLNRNLKKRNETLKLRIKLGMHKQARKVICINTGEVFDCINDAIKKYNAPKICECCRHRRKTSGTLNGEKLRWEYYKD